MPDSENLLLQPDKEIVMTFEDTIQRSRANNGFDGFCRIVFSFMPEKDAHYTFKAGYADSVKNALLGHCTADLEKVGSNAFSEAVDIKYFEIRQRSIACIRAEPLSK
ncbi:hypothetical protein [Glaciimonas sp. PAMC28666]|uniref:hypothetical protein n=1 Tax=Glaciimonas sp. PAMC28666 TaxID=2807626 RepID=UPI0019650631|nr:hypothetical protein [Glaciimonas sp. PAMC28666]QRX80835.1 hypothetical protein JQN73_11385 [Glaciimonas sp. PAMC28666]